MTTTRIDAAPGDTLITMARRFAAPPDLVLRAHVEPDLLVRWLGPRRMRMTVHEFAARDGGRWRYTHTDEDGTAHGFRGVFHGDPGVGRGITQTFEYDGWPGEVSLNRLTLEADGDGTLLRTVSAFLSVEARDAMVASGMGDGVRDGYARLDEVLAGLATAEPGRAR